MGRMTGFVLDGPNCVTLFGLGIGFAALIQTIQGATGLGLALALIAIVLDNVDGALARRAPDRSPALQRFGAQLDCFADFVSKGVFPPLLLLATLGYGSSALAIGGFHLVAITLRYSWELGTDAPPRGVSPDYAIVVFAMLHLLRGALGEAHGGLLALSMLAFAGLAIAPLRVPKLAGWGLGTFMALAIALVITLFALD
jgi:phosphatidylserine synthase